MEPLISLTIRNPKPFFRPGEDLLCEYQIDAIGENEIVAVEASVLWYTEGKGDEDLGLHYFERRLPGEATDSDLRELSRFETRCPNSPLSYEGELIKIRWCVRVRVFLPKGQEIFFELPFRLGNLQPPRLAQAAENEVPPTDEHEEEAELEAAASGEDSIEVSPNEKLSNRADA